MSSQTIRNYHNRTKHQLHAYARGPEFLDWNDQPDLFRRFQGSEIFELPFIQGEIQQTTDLNLISLSALLEQSVGLSAWKQYGPDRWSLRCNPSSGNLHPTEIYIISSGLKDLDDAVYHYAPHEHALEKRSCITSQYSSPHCLIGLSSISWREAWKYGERAYRYVQLDVGHALGAIRYAAATLGWAIEIVPVADEQITKLLGLNREEDFENAEKEHPDLLIRIKTDSNAHRFELPSVSQWQGKANFLGGTPKHEWTVIDEVSHAASCDKAVHKDYSPVIQIPEQLNPLVNQSNLPDLIRQRRSAQAYIGKQSSISEDIFYRILDSVLYRPEIKPWDSWVYQPVIHLVLFVHRVENLAPGIYLLPRLPEKTEQLKSHLTRDFLWEKPANCPDHIPLHLLETGDARKLARAVSCHQEIASASSFSLGMLAEFDDVLQDNPAGYRHMFWEAGLVGQALYLQAEAAGIRGTGIGCFFDDEVHQVLGISGTNLQSMYHFTIGFPREDLRLQTLPPYDHLSHERFLHE